MNDRSNQDDKTHWRKLYPANGFYYIVKQMRD